ncbi:HGxxPAAW family protein [Streptomyces griseosporeus]|uniref:HGxxPAAW family protein n=1 Tax=Streptomyces griseosporeus TaxID=1910 RepID=UPI0036FE8D27
MSLHGDDPYDLGHTVAGWTGTALAALGSGGCALGVITASGPLIWGGAGVLVLALCATWALHLAGWGKASGPRPVEQWDWRVRDPGARNGHPGCLGCRLAGRPGASRRHRQPGVAAPRSAGAAEHPVGEPRAAA